MRATSAITALAIAIAACAGNGESTTTSTQSRADTTTSTSTTLPLVVGCPQEGAFVEGGNVAAFENQRSDTNTIGLISWQTTEACESFEISFETSEGAPATTPPSITADYLESIGVLRVRTDAQSTVITDQLVETEFVDRLYVVRSIDGGVFIDFHLTSPSQARIVLESSPASMTLQLQPGIIDFTGEPAASGPVVLTSPMEDSTVPTEITVEGYARTFESNVLIIATQGDQVVAEQNTTAADSVDTWGEFRATTGLVPGQVSLFVGEDSAESGRFEGVSIDLKVE